MYSWGYEGYVIVFSYLMYVNVCLEVTVCKISHFFQNWLIFDMMSPAINLKILAMQSSLHGLAN